MLASLNFDQDVIPLVSLSCCIYREDACGKYRKILKLKSKTKSIAKQYSTSFLVENKNGILPCSL